MRLESDSFGQEEVSSEKLWGAMTQRSWRNFKIGSEKMPKEIIESYGIIKLAIFELALRQGKITAEMAKAMAQAASEVASGDLHDHFPLMVWQTGSGTQTNMNVNEVIANRANQILGQPLGKKDPVHPNDHVNIYQSTNDSFPTAMHIAVAVASQGFLQEKITKLEQSLEKKIKQFEGIVKIGRTHFQDATPLYLSQEFSGYLTQVSNGKKRIIEALKEVYCLAQGGTAVGTGINTYIGFDVEFADLISKMTGLPFRTADNKFEALASHDAITNFSGTLNTLATSLHKIANDIRFLGSGPRCGIGEIVLPANEPGSSIMPGKVNPTQCEALSMVCAQVMGNHLAISFANANGNLELNVYKPLIAYNILQSIRLIADACDSFATLCIDGIQADESRIKFLLDQSLMLVTALAPKIGYDNAAQIAKKAHLENKTLRAVALELNLLTNEEFDAIVIPENMVNPS